MAQYEFKSTFKAGTRNPEITTIVYADTYFEAVRKMDESNGFVTVVLRATRDGRSLTIDHDTADQRRDRIDALPDLAPSAPAASVLDRINKMSAEHYAMAVGMDRIEAKVATVLEAFAKLAADDTVEAAALEQAKRDRDENEKLKGSIYNLEGDRNELVTMLGRLSTQLEFRTGEESKAINAAHALLIKLAPPKEIK